MRRPAPNDLPSPAAERPRSTGDATGDALLSADSEIGGLRVVRRLGAGERAEVYLAVSAARDDSRSPVALKAYRPAVSDGDIARELEALTRFTSEHTARLVDVASDAHGRPCLVLERYPKGSLADLMTSGRSLTAGEAVTILAPLAQLVAEAHSAGVAHGAFGLRRVLFSARGAPVLIGWGRASVFGPGSSAVDLERHAAATLDRTRLRRMAGVVLDAVTGDAAVQEAATALAGWLGTEPDTAGFPREFADRLFTLAEPRPVSLEGPSALLHVVRPAPSSAATEQVHDGAAAGAPAWLAALPLPDWLRDACARWLRRIPTARLVGQLRTVRRPFWIAAGSAALALVAGLLLVPADGDARQDAQARSDPRAGQPVTDVTPADVSGAGAVLGDDPLAAVPVLLDLRSRCLRDLSILCLDGALQQESAALSDDEAVIRAIRDGQVNPASVDIPDAQPVLVERLGASALVDLGTDSEPASLLMIRGEAGWRIRAYLSD